jgi:MHS family proline/betaine transporter-like MFS transporter
LLTVARLLQGLSFGAEIPNMTAIIRENTTPGASGKYFGFMMSSTAVGTLLAYSILMILTRLFSQAEIIAWVWRIPFLLGGVLALWVFVLRTRIDETPDFLEVQQSKRLHQNSRQITVEIFTHYWKNLINGLSATLFFSFLIIFSIYLPVYLKQYFHYETNTIFFWMTLSILLSVFLSPLFGYIFDHLNRTKALKIVTFCFLGFLAFSLKLLASQTTFALVFFLLGYQLFIAVYATNIFVLLSTLFPLHIRSTGIGICYNTGHSIGSMTPLILTSLIHAQNYHSVVMIFASIVVTLTILGSLPSPGCRHLFLEKAGERSLT